MDTSTARLPSLYIPHGGGPCFFMEPQPGLPRDLWDRMAAYLRGIGASLPARPRAVLVISAHWECPRVTVHNAAHHSLLFDYYGFPEHTYRLTYPVAGDPALAEEVRKRLLAAQIPCDTESERGIDHGVFVPFKLIFPEADIPIVQLSLRSGLDPAVHLQLGAALAPLRERGVLIVGSGMSYHNLRRFFASDEATIAAATKFDAWLQHTLTAPAAARHAGLIDWVRAPGAAEAHPRAEHLLPLMVAAGAAGDEPAWRAYHEPLLGKPVAAYHFGDAAGAR